ncbi:2351_t:CDS:2, partial [Gigaspora rosea]
KCELKKSSTKRTKSLLDKIEKESFSFPTLSEPSITNSEEQEISKITTIPYSIYDNYE